MTVSARSIEILCTSVKYNGLLRDGLFLLSRLGLPLATGILIFIFYIVCQCVTSKGLGDVILSKYNHKIFIEGKTKKEVFWNIVHEKKKIYKLEFKLISPNILDTNQKARDALKALKEIFEQEEIDITLKNDSGNLKVPEEPVGGYLEYIAEGEGTWKITTEGDRGGKKTHSSSENIDTISLPELDSKSEFDNQLQLLDGNELPKKQGFSEARLGAEAYAAINDMEKN